MTPVPIAIARCKSRRWLIRPQNSQSCTACPKLQGLAKKQIDYAADLRAKYIAKNKQMCDAMQQMFTKFDYAQINTLAAQNNLTPTSISKNPYKTIQTGVLCTPC
jgi:hypothetical protein